ncbi:TIGR01459 family HAD-type hydrolase [Arenibaculum sp.]|uniref:TIGR01459 family HAD-type hydrolase n=1 Tax=Arenibaculum sp. TaxID=2865862 RepID=UPI002E1341DC|nr:TIGR01459 family HAD-type hydrolase [Arenibaculum sp.]
MADRHSSELPFLSGVGEIADRYDGFILDLWGVLHNGVEPLPGALDALDRLRAAGKKVCLLSNAPRRCASVATKLGAMGITGDHYHHLMTSGEATHEALRDRPDGWHRALGRRCLHIGPPRDEDVFEGLDIEMVGAPAEADFIVNTGIDDFSETVADYADVLSACAQRRLPMVCANPDLVVVVGTEMAICAGSLAAHYEDLGGDVRYHGKPHAPVYARCLDLLGIGDRRRILAVGDSFRTDVAGANAAGIDSLLVTSGIHLEELAKGWGETPDPARLAAAAQAAGHLPQAAVARFAW